MKPPSFFFSSWVKQPSSPQNPHGFSPIACNLHSSGTAQSRRSQSICPPTCFHIYFKEISFCPQSKQGTLSFPESFCLRVRTFETSSTINDSFSLMLWYGKAELLIECNNSTFPKIFSLSGSSESHRNLRTNWSSVADTHVGWSEISSSPELSIVRKCYPNQGCNRFYWLRWHWVVL